MEREETPDAHSRSSKGSDEEEDPERHLSSQLVRRLVPRLAELESQEQRRRNHGQDDRELDPGEPVPFASCTNESVLRPVVPGEHSKPHQDSPWLNRRSASRSSPSPRPNAPVDPSFGINGAPANTEGKQLCVRHLPASRDPARSSGYRSLLGDLAFGAGEVERVLGGVGDWIRGPGSILALRGSADLRESRSSWTRNKAQADETRSRPYLLRAPLFLESIPIH